MRSKRNYAWLPFAGDSLIGRIRSVACTSFLEKKLAPYMIFLDGDIVFEPEDIERLYRRMFLQQYDLIGGLYVVKSGQSPSSYPIGGKMNWNDIIGNLVVEVEYLSTGFMGISWRLLDKIQKELNLPLLHPDAWCRCYPFFESGRHTDKDIYISEDWDFCEKARQVGVKPYLDLGIRLGHKGDKVYEFKDMVEYRKTKQKDGTQMPPDELLCEK